MRPLNPWEASGGFDFTPVLLAIVLMFAVIAPLQFLRSLPGGERGILRFEKSCPIYSTAPRRP